MTRRILGALRSLVAEPGADSSGHFHGDGRNGEPAACFDSQCGRPALDIS
jgi:hypothetical protein